jgi:hypothetical protein
MLFWSANSSFLYHEHPCTCKAREDRQHDVEGLAVLALDVSGVEVTVELDAIEARLLEAIDVGGDADAPLHHLLGQRVLAFALIVEVTYGDKTDAKGPYRSEASVSLMIARQLKREVTKRDAVHKLPE